MKRTLIVLACLFVLLVPVAASFAADGAAAVPLRAAAQVTLPAQPDLGSAPPAHFAAWLAQQDQAGQSPAFAARPPQPLPICSSTFCNKCAAGCCPTSTGGCICCRD